MSLALPICDIVPHHEMQENAQHILPTLIKRSLSLHFALHSKKCSAFLYNKNAISAIPARSRTPTRSSIESALNNV